MKNLKDLSIGIVTKQKPAKVIEKGKNLHELLNASFQGVKRLSFLAYVIAADNNADEEAGIKSNTK